MEESNTTDRNQPDFITAEEKNESNWIMSVDGEFSQSPMQNIVDNNYGNNFQLHKEKTVRMSDIVTSSMRKDRPSYTNSNKQNSNVESSGPETQLKNNDTKIVNSENLTPKGSEKNIYNPSHFSVSNDKQVEEFIKKITDEAINLKCEEHGQNLLNICTNPTCSRKFWCGICCVKFKKDFSNYIDSMMTIEDFIIENTNKLKNHKVYSDTDKKSVINIIDENEGDKIEKYNTMIEKIDSDINAFKDMVINMIERGRKELIQQYLDSQNKGSEFYQELRGKINNLDLIDPNQKILELKDDFDSNDKGAVHLIKWLEENVNTNLPEWQKRNTEFEDINSFSQIQLDNEDNWQKKIVANYQPFSHWKEDSSRKIEKDFMPLLKLSFKSQEKDLKSYFNYYNGLSDDTNKIKKCKEHILTSIAVKESITSSESPTDQKDYMKLSNKFQQMDINPKTSVIINEEINSNFYGVQNNLRPNSVITQFDKFRKKPESDKNIESMFYSRQNQEYEAPESDLVTKTNVMPQEIDSSQNNTDMQIDTPLNYKPETSAKKSIYTNILEKKFNLNQPGNQGIIYPKIETLNIDKNLEDSPDFRNQSPIDEIQKKYMKMSYSRIDVNENHSNSNKKTIPTQIESNKEIKLDYMRLSGNYRNNEINQDYMKLSDSKKDNLQKQNDPFEPKITESKNFIKTTSTNQTHNILQTSLNNKMSSLNATSTNSRSIAQSYDFNNSSNLIPKLDLKRSQHIKNNFQPEQDTTSDGESKDLFKNSTLPNPIKQTYNYAQKKITERDSEFDINMSDNEFRKFTPKANLHNKTTSAYSEQMNITPETMNRTNMVTPTSNSYNVAKQEIPKFPEIKQRKSYNQDDDQQNFEDKILKKYTLNLENVHKKNNQNEQNFKKNTDSNSMGNLTSNFHMINSDYSLKIDPGSFGGNFQEDTKKSAEFISGTNQMSSAYNTNNIIIPGYNELDPTTFNSEQFNTNTLPFNMTNYYNGDTQLSTQTKASVKSNSLINDGCIMISYAINDVTPIILIIKNKYILTSFCKQGTNKEQFFGFNVMKIERSANDQYTPYLYSSDKDIVMNSRVDNIIFTHRDSDQTDLVIVTNHDGSIFQFKVEENAYDFFNIKMIKKIRPISKGLYFTWITNYKSSDLLLCCSFNGKIYIFNTSEGLLVSSENVFDGCISSTTYISGCSMMAQGSGSSNQKHENSITIFELNMDSELSSANFSGTSKTNKSILSFSQKIKLKRCHGEKFGVFCLSSTNIKDSYILFSGGCDDDSRIKVWHLLKDPCLLYQVKAEENIVNFMFNVVCFGVQQLDETTIKNKDFNSHKYGSQNAGPYIKSNESVLTNAYKKQSHLLNERRDELKRLKEHVNSHEIVIQHQNYESTESNMIMHSAKTKSLGIGDLSSLVINQFDKYNSQALQDEMDKNGNIENHILLVYTKNFIRVINFQIERLQTPIKQESMRLMEGDSIEFETYMNSGQEFRITHTENRIPFNTKSAIYSRVLQTRKINEKQFSIMAASSNKQISCYNLFI